MFPKFLNPIEVHSVHELGLGAIFALFFWTIGFIVYCVNVSFRFIAQQVSNFYHPGRYVIADGEDSVFGVKLHGSSKSYIYGYKIIRGKPDINVIRSKVEEIFTKTKRCDKLKYMMIPKNGYFFWDKKVPFDIARNVRLLDDFNPNEIVDETRLTEICGQLVGTEVGNENMPQWEILMLPKYKMENEPATLEETSHYALIIRMHHAYCDGISFVLLTNDFLSDVPGELPIDPRKGFQNPVWIKAYIWAKILLIGPLNFFKNLAILVLSKSHYRVERYVSSKVLARSSPVELELLKKIRIASGSSITSITISAVYGALYKTHLRIFPGKPVQEILHLGSIGVMLPYDEQKYLVNQFTMWRYTGPLKVNDAKERLEKTFEEIRRSASQPDPVFNFFMQRALGSLPKFLHEILFSLSGTPVMLSNVPGYKTPVKVFGGEIVDVAAWIPLVTTTGIGLSSQTYCGKMVFSAIVDPQIFPNAAEAKLFLDDIVNEIYILAEAYGVQDIKAVELENVAGTIQSRIGEGQPTSTYHEVHMIEGKDVNHNDKLTVVTIPSPSSSPSPPTNSIIQSDQQCRLRKDDNLKVGEGETAVNDSSSSFEKKVEKVI